MDNYFGEEERDGKRVRFVPLWCWLARGERTINDTHAEDWTVLKHPETTTQQTPLLTWNCAAASICGAIVL
jgi:hypothetical protein